MRASTSLPDPATTESKPFLRALRGCPQHVCWQSFRPAGAALISIFLALVFSLLITGRAFAQAAPTAVDQGLQEQRRQQERDDALRRQQERTPDVRLPEQAPAPAARLPDREAPCFPISRLELAGDESARFVRWLDAANGEQRDDSPLGRCLGAEGISIVMKRVQNALLAAGFVTTRVLAAPQDLKAGVLVLSVLPGRIGSIRFSADSNERGTWWNALPARPGDILNLRDIEQALENLKRVPSAEADIRIEAGAVLGESDLVISYRQGVPLRFALSLDDAGSRATGRMQAAATLSYDHWWTLNDLFYLSFNRDLHHPSHPGSGIRGGTVHYSVPVGYWAFAGTLSRSRYHRTVAGLYENSVYAGINRNAELKVSRLMYRDAARKTTLSLRTFQRSSSNYSDDVEIEVQRRVASGWEAALAHREFIGRASADVALAYRRGTGAFGALPAVEEMFGEGSARAGLATADVGVAAPLSMLAAFPDWLRESGLRFTANWRAQWNRAALTPQDQFSIGGRHTVRGFDGELSLSGDRGWLLRSELSVPIADGHEAYAALDHGRIGGRAAEFALGDRLTGAALGLRGTASALQSIQYELFCGVPLSRPSGFATAGLSAGFNLNLAF